MIDVKARLAEMQERLGLSDGPPGWEEMFIVNPGEIPWWRIDDYKERHGVYNQQRQRVTKITHPRYFSEATMKSCKKHPETREKYLNEHPELLAEIRKRYNETPGGKAARAKGTATRRRRSDDPALYAARTYLLHDLQESCAICGALYDITHVIDHIIALCLGGTDAWDNYQPACILCHREKTAEDLRKYGEVLRRQANVI